MSHLKTPGGRVQATLAVCLTNVALRPEGVVSAVAPGAGQRWFGLFEQVAGVSKADFRRCYAAAAFRVSALKQA